MHFDVFNGDADGILSLLQLRLAEPKSSELISGVKRDIALLKKVDLSKASSITVLDISLEKNIEALDKALAQGVEVRYFDHHRPGDIPSSPLLNVHIDTDANVCTALLVDSYLKQQYSLWAITAAFGDNLQAVARQRACALNLDSALVKHLEQLGTAINYNGYGRYVSDLHFAPQALFRLLLPFDSPVPLIEDTSSLYYQLWDAYQQDIAKAQQVEALYVDDACKVVRLPDTPWANRVSGVFGNLLANQAPDKAHAVLTENADGTSYTVSVRAPLSNKQGAGDLCAQFPSGGGRAGAGGINALNDAMLGTFIDKLKGQWR